MMLQSNQSPNPKEEKILTSYQDFLEILQAELSEKDFETWVRPILLSCEKGNYFLYAPNVYVMGWAQENLLDRFLQYCDVDGIRLCLGRPKKQESVVLKQDIQTQDKREEKIDYGDQSLEVIRKRPKVNMSLETAYINPLFTFDSFVLGSSNELAFSAAKRIAEGGASMGNPLTIYGPSGLGKTHLLHAIANHMKVKKDNFRYSLMSSEFFYHQLVRALRERDRTKLEAFKDFFRNLDLLMIDDIQFFAKKERTQDELFFVYHALVDRGGQIVLTSDQYPRDISDIEERLKTRFSSGLPVAVEPPDIETRMMILMKKAKETFKVDLPPNCAELMAQKIQSNVRELEAALNKIMAHSDLYGEPIGVPLIYNALKEIFEQKEQKISVDNIQKIVAEYYKIRLMDMLSKSRLRQVVVPRQMAIYLTKELTKMSLSDIGRAFGQRDHTTVIHSIQKIDKSRKDSYAMEVDYKNLIRRLTC